jgi:hypothetical protein
MTTLRDLTGAFTPTIDHVVDERTARNRAFIA